MKRLLPILGSLAVLAVITLVLAEIALRAWVPLSSLVDPNGLYPKVWYLDHVDSLVDRAEHPSHVSHPVLGWTYAANVRQGELSTNAEGLRGRREYPLERVPGRRRGIVLGDSFSAGYGVGDDESYAARLEGMLPGTEILNLAVPGYGVDQAILRWELMGRAYQPDFVILGIFLPDFHRNAGTWWFDAPKPRFRIVDGELYLPDTPLPPMEDTRGNEARIREELAPLLRMPRVWVAGQYVAGRIAGRLRGWREPDTTFSEKQQLLELLIERLATDCRRRGVDLAIVTILTDYAAYPDEARILQVIADAADRVRVPVLDLERFLGADPGDGAAARVFDPATQHWSAYGHARAAETIARFLQVRGIVMAESAATPGPD